MVLLAVSMKLLAEIAMLMLLGRGALALLVGRGRERNGVYRLFDPVLRLVRRVTPRAVADRDLPVIAVLLLSMLWLGALLLKVHFCLMAGMVGCR
jgi:uncharacterized protein YggT (Ycf19 family)